MKRPTAYHHGDLPRIILRATLSLIEQEGVAHLSMREIARNAGVSHAAPYHHFGDKAGVIAALAADGFELLEAALRSAVERAEGPQARFEACGRAYVRFAVGHPAYFRVMFRPERASAEEHSRVSPRAHAAYQVLVEVVSECRRAGLGLGVAPRALVLTGWSTVHGLASLLVNGPSALGAGALDNPERLERVVAKTLGTLLAQGARDR
jgi:AcrR family transcriptional regulator